MRQIHVLVEKTHPLRFVPGYWLPVALNRRHLKELGMRFRFFKSVSPEIFECDVLFLTSANLCPGNTVGDNPQSREELLSRLGEFRGRVKNLVWFDLADSTGTTQFEVLPYVKKYLKKQLLKDRGAYRKNLYGGRIFADYFHHEHGLEEPRGPFLADNPDYYYRHHSEVNPITTIEPLPVGMEGRVGVGWNIGLHDMRGGKLLDKVRNRLADAAEVVFGTGHRLPWRRAPAATRDVALAGMYQIHGRPIGAFQRRRFLELAKGWNDDRVHCAASRIPYREYMNILSNAKIGLSLFGLGEVCYREFEIFVTGGALMMPDMSHLETWPDVYLPKQTYWPVRWDLADLKDAYDHLLANDKVRLEMAVAGQERYAGFWSRAGKEAFCGRLKKTVDEVVGG